MGRRVTPLLLVLSALLGALPAQAATAPAPGSITIRLLEASTARADDPRARIYINDHVAPGATIRRRIEVANTTGAPQALDFYAGAADVRGGSFDIADGRAVNDLTSWTTVTPAGSTVPDGGRVELQVVVRVPRDAAAGERYGAVLAERPAPAPVPGSVSTGARVGIRMYLSVGPGGEPPTDFRVDTLTARRTAQGEPVVQAAVTNTGGRALDLSGDLRLGEGPAGMSAGPFQASLGTTLAVGRSAPVSVVLDRAVPAGPWTAVLVLRSGRVERRVRATINFPTGAATTGAPVRPLELTPAEDPSIVIPVATGLLGLVALLLLLVLWRRRSPDDDEAGQDAPAVAATSAG